MKFTHQFLVVGTNQGENSDRIFAYFNSEEDAREHAKKFPQYKHVRVYKEIKQNNCECHGSFHEENCPLRVK